jgi:hypothetical protein
MGSSARSKKKRWRNRMIGGIACLALVWGGYIMSQAGGVDSKVGGAGTDATSIDATGIGSSGYRYGTQDGTAIQNW